MPDWIPVSRTQHAHQCCLPRVGYTFATDNRLVEVLLAELAKVIPHHVLGFIRQGEAFQPVALLSLDGHANLYIAPDGRWLGRYVPAALRGYPFALRETSRGEKALCIEASHLSQDQGQALFDAQGELSPGVARTFHFLQQCDRSREATHKATATLAEAGVITPWPLEIPRGDDRPPLKVEGLYRIDEKALNGLAAEAYTALRGGPMALAYAQLFSMAQVHQLTERADYHARHGGGSLAGESLDALFDADEDLSFDFDS